GSRSACVQDVHRGCALPENDSGCAPTARLSAESSDIYSRSTPPSNFEIGSNDFQSCAAVLNCRTSSFTSIWSRRERPVAALEEVAGRGTTLAVAPVNAGCSPPRQRRIAGWQQAVRRLGQRSSPCSLARPPS